jgi:sterol 3beta-glucosyltransferase
VGFITLKLTSWPFEFSYILFDLLIWVILATRINTWRKSVLGLEKTTFSQLRLDQVPFLYNFSSLVVPRPEDWKPWVKTTGYWFLDPPKNATSEKDPENSIPEGLRQALNQAKESGRKIVYIGFGSVRIYLFSLFF